jgi:hypothetical protein
MLYEKINLEEEEKVVVMVRKHWFVLATELFGTVLLAFLPLVIMLGILFVPENNYLPNSLAGYYAIITFTSALWITFCIMGATMIWTHYYLDLWIVTDRRIIVIDQVHFFNRKVSSFRLERLQDIKVKVDGIIPTFLNFGTIRAQTASAAESNFMTTGLPDPRGLQAIIQKAMDARLRVINTQMQAVIDA